MAAKLKTVFVVGQLCTVAVRGVLLISVCVRVYVWVCVRIDNVDDGWVSCDSVALCYMQSGWGVLT